ncbi:MAG: hypothetical protein OXF01_10650 [Gemmatimonadetes bacterium]|nr:hypothetical protein [Gemmatimonadota bacterium]
MATQLKLFRSRPDHDAFPRALAYALLVVVGLYAVYNVGVFFALGRDTSVLYRVFIMVAMAAFPLPVLVAPATYFAALDTFDLHGQHGPGVRARHWKLLGALALVAYLVVAMGPAVHDNAVDVVMGPIEARPEEGMVADPQARFVVPFAVALFVVVGGVAGAMAGRITRGLTSARRNIARWIVCMGMLASFMVTLVVVAELIKMRGILSPPWLALAPPAVPFALVCVLGWRDCARFAGTVLTRLGRGRPAVDAAALAEALRRTAAPEVAVCASQVDAVVGILAAVPRPTKPRSERRRDRSWRRMGMTAGFLGAWATVSIGFLFLGGADLSPPTIVSGVAAGFCGSMVAFSCHLRGRAPAQIRTAH